jgi:hypothetical protein
VILDRSPAVTDGDEDIREWAIQKGLSRLPIAYVELAYAIRDDEPDVAVIEFGKRGMPVHRVSWQQRGVRP